MANIQGRAAWGILRRYVQDCLEIDSATLLAIYAIGSLPGGYYRPGQSDIDALLVVANHSQAIWGDSEEPCQRLHDLNRAYLQGYGIPKDFRPFPLQEHQLWPPYGPEPLLLTLEIARLKTQSKRLYGALDPRDIPMPQTKHFFEDEQRFEQWMSAEFLPAHHFGALSGAACANTILMHLGRFLRLERGLILFDKYKLIPTYLRRNPPFADRQALGLVSKALKGQQLSRPELDALRRYAAELRAGMNDHLGIRS